MTRLFIAVCVYLWAQGGLMANEVGELGYYDANMGFHPYSKQVQEQKLLEWQDELKQRVTDQEDAKHTAALLNLSLGPPDRYDHKPTSVVVEEVLPFGELQGVCRRLFDSVISKAGHTNDLYRGCARVQRGDCHIYIADGTPEKVAATRRHEYGHCNGWGPNHEP